MSRAQRARRLAKGMENSASTDAGAAFEPVGAAQRETAGDQEPADRQERERALNPKTSCIVQAPAGSGKTTLLVQRFAKLLARVERPEQILAITFTRKAAAEMRQRVLKVVRGEESDADHSLSRAIRAQDRKRGWGLALNPSRLKIQTIDSFARSLAGALPLGAGPEGRATPVEDAAPLYDGAVDRLFERLRDADGASNAGLAPDIGRFLMLVDNDAAKGRRQLVEMLARRDQWLAPVQELLRTQLEAPERVAAALNGNVRKLTEAVIDDLRQTLGQELQAELQWLVRFATEHGGPQGAFWPTAKALCMTGANRFRKTLTKQQGFPPGCQAEKERALAAIGKLRDLRLRERFAALANLPEGGLGDGQVQDIVALCATLTLAVLDLNQVMRAEGRTDFTQLNIAARQALERDGAPTELALALDYRIRHILIDEFQDTSIAQFELLSLLIEGWTGQEDTSVFAVGDPMQSIYRFRDADVGLFQRAKDEGVNAVHLQPLRLKVNFRSAAALIDWFNRTFVDIMDARDDPNSGAVRYHGCEANDQSQAGAPKAKQPAPEAQDRETGSRNDGARTKAGAERPAGASPSGARVRLFSKSPSEPKYGLEAEAVAQQVKALSETDPEGKIALLVRSRNHLPDLLNALRRENIPWQATDIDPLAEAPTVMDLLSLASALTDPSDRLAWLSVLRTPWVGLDLPGLEKAAKLQEFSVKALQRLAEQLGGGSGKRLKRLTASLARWLPRLYEEAPRTALEAIWLECGAPVAYADGGCAPERGQTDAGQTAASAQALEQAGRFFDLVDELGADGLDTEQLRVRTAQLFASDSAPAQLQILTIHKAKGLEFDHVILPCLDRGVRRRSRPILHWRRQGGRLLMAAKDSGGLYKWLHEEDGARERHELRRLLYVACTRAKRSLLLTASVELADRPQEQRNPSAKPDIKPPESGSMLALLRPLLQQDPLPVEGATEAVEPASGSKSEAASTSATTAKPSQPPRLHRLPEDFSWRPPPPPSLTLPPVLQHRANAAGETTARQRDVVFGNLIHESLCAWGRGPLPEDAAAWIAPRRDRWRRRLRTAGLNEGEANDHLQEAERQLTAVLADPDGRWLLGPRTEAASEFGVTGLIDGALANAYFDRTFKHEGVRWIIDFKTAKAEDEAAVNALASRHQPQLAHYRTLAEGLFDQPVKTALYLTAIPKLVEVAT